MPALRWVLGLLSSFAVAVGAQPKDRAVTLKLNIIFIEDDSDQEGPGDGAAVRKRAKVARWLAAAERDLPFVRFRTVYRTGTVEFKNGKLFLSGTDHGAVNVAVFDSLAAFSTTAEAASISYAGTPMVLLGSAADEKFSRARDISPGRPPLLQTGLGADIARRHGHLVRLRGRHAAASRPIRCRRGVVQKGNVAVHPSGPGRLLLA